jgi:acylglycerol lipase
VQEDAGTLTTADGLTLATRRWLPQGGARAAVLIAHGLGEHSGRYAHLAARLTKAGIGVYSYDHRHHGRSGGTPRGLLSDFSRLLQDLALVLAWVRTENQGPPLFLVGHSLGGAIAARYVAEGGGPGLSGLVLMSPALRIPKGTAPVARRLAPILTRFFPAIEVLSRDHRLLSRDPVARRAWRRDPLIYKGGLRARTGYIILQNSLDLIDHAEAFAMPLLVMHGTADEVTDPEGSHLLFDAASSADKTLMLYDGFYHELLNDRGSEQVVEDLVGWLDERASSGADEGARPRNS